MNIIVTGDILRPEVLSGGTLLHHQRNNITWIDEQFSKLFEFIKIYHREGEILHTVDWFKTDTKTSTECYHITRIKELGLNPTDCLIIGFEIPRNALYQFREMNIKYIDFFIHPIRFLDKRIIGYESNLIIPNDKDTIVEDIKIKAKTFNPAILDKEYHLVIGQTEIDRSLISNGSKKWLMNFRQDLLEISEDAPLLYKPHPLSKNYQVDIMKQLGADITKENVYKLMASDKIKSVVGISSSVLYEAEYFNKPALFLKKRWQMNVNNMIYEEKFFSKEFWIDLFAKNGIL